MADETASTSTPSDGVESLGGAHFVGLEPINAGPDLEKQTTAGSGLSVFEQRAQSVMSRIRSREPGQTAPFTHPLFHSRTSDEVIIDFDGPDDPYRPLNWGFRKKAVTTILYGLTTMGVLLFFSLLFFSSFLLFLFFWLSTAYFLTAGF